MAKLLTKLGALRLLSDGMVQLESRRQQRVAGGNAPHEVDRETAQMALNEVVTFFLDHGIESRPLVRLLSELSALNAGAKPSRMLTPDVTGHRPPDAPTVEALKGRLAAIMESRQQAGLSRKAAGEWIVRHAPAELKRRLGVASRATVDSWLAKWGGRYGRASPSGREGYLHMRALLEQQRPTEQQLKKIMAVLAKKLPG